MKYFIISALICLLPNYCIAATGDVLWRCTFDGTGTTASSVISNCGGSPASDINSFAAIVTGGHDGGKAVSYYYPNLGGEIVSSFYTPHFNKQEITIDYWEKLDVDPASSGIWNVKSIRPFVGESGSDYYTAIMSPHGNYAIYQSPWAGAANLTTTSKVSGVHIDASGYCTGSGLNYVCDDGRLEVKVANWGTAWHNIRYYMKPPSAAGHYDGTTTVWIDGELLYTLTGQGPSSIWSSSWNNYIHNIQFHPSDDFFQGVSGTKFPFHHMYDDITVYEGYVPPGAAGLAAPPLSPPVYSK